MQKVAPPAPATRPLWMVILAAGLIVGIAMGLRQVMGLYLPPMTKDLGIGREPFSMAMAVANLVWGFGAVFAGMIADRYGAGRVVVAGTVATMAGMYLMYAAQSGFDLLISGVLLGIGVSGTGLNSLVGAVGRAAPPDKRTSAIASLGMAGGHRRVRRLSLHAPADGSCSAGRRACCCCWRRRRWCCRSPGRSPASPTPAPAWSTRSALGAAFKEALTHPSYLLLVIGFFVCGFHVAFYGVHLPGFVADKGLDAQRRRHRADHGGPRQSRRHLSSPGSRGASSRSGGA